MKLGGFLEPAGSRLTETISGGMGSSPISDTMTQMRQSHLNRPDRPLRIAIIGAGPAGVYTSDILTKEERDFHVNSDLFDRYPAPFGLIPYGVAPDHPRIKGSMRSLHKVMDRGDIGFFGNVDFGTDVILDDLRRHYDAIVL